MPIWLKLMKTKRIKEGFTLKIIPMNENNDLKYVADIEEDVKKKKKEITESEENESKLEVFME